MSSRKGLKLKILGKYGSVKAFCADINYSRTQVSNILSCKEDGGKEFWKKASEKLDLSDEELMKYIFYGEIS